jgi:hypothetical protein
MFIRFINNFLRIYFEFPHFSKQQDFNLKRDKGKKRKTFVISVESVENFEIENSKSNGFLETNNFYEKSH